jgi:hypothetical protein
MERLRHYFHANMAALLETDPDVLYWTTEVDAYRFQHRGRDIVFIPSFQVEDVGGTRVIRLVRAQERASLRSQEHHRLLRRLFRQRGMEFDVLSDAELASHPRLRSAKEILFHRYWDVPDDLPYQVAIMAASHPPATLGELHERLGGGAVVWEQVLSLVAQGFVELEARPGLTAETGIRACKMKGHRQ